VTNLVNVQREGPRVKYCRMLYCIPWSCLVHTIDHFDSEGWFGCEQVILNVFGVFAGKTA